MPHPVNRQQDVLNNVVHQHAVGNLLANNRPDRRDDSPQQLCISLAFARLSASH